MRGLAAWEGRTLPTEAEWEFAARGGLDGAAFAWGDEFLPGDRHMANTWQGEFPWQHRSQGRLRAHVARRRVSAERLRAYDVIGNVWEWTTDWYQPKHPHDEIKACCIPANPRGPRAEDSYDPRQPDDQIPRKVLKGGSHLCAPNYCRRYRPAARYPQPVDTSRRTSVSAASSAPVNRRISRANIAARRLMRHARTQNRLAGPRTAARHEAGAFEQHLHRLVAAVAEHRTPAQIGLQCGRQVRPTRRAWRAGRC